MKSLLCPRCWNGLIREEDRDPETGKVENAWYECTNSNCDYRCGADSLDAGTPTPARGADAAPEKLPLEKLNAGDRVTWTHTSQQGSGFRFRTRRGVVQRHDGRDVLVRQGNGRRVWIARMNLRREGETTALTEAFNAMAKEVGQ